MSSSDVERYMGSTLTARGLALDEVDPDVVYGERPAWAVFYRGPDCKLQVCWSARDGGVDFMLALSDATDDLGTPPLGAGTDEVWAWRKALFDTHFEAARSALQRTG
jgi:hypothetical protein